MRTFLVTGGAGFIGSNIAEALVARNEKSGNSDWNLTALESPLVVILDMVDDGSGTGGSVGFDDQEGAYVMRLAAWMGKYGGTVALRHEMKHICQQMMGFLSTGHSSNKGFGTGKKSDRDRGVSQFEPNYMLNGEPGEPHGLGEMETYDRDDSEFYTRMEGGVAYLISHYGFGKRKDGKPSTRTNPGTSASRMSIIKDLLGNGGGIAMEGIRMELGLKGLKNNPGKYRRMVNELIKMYVHLEGLEDLDEWYGRIGNEWNGEKF